MGTSKINSRIRKQTTICHDRIRCTINYNSKSSKILRYLHYWSFLQPRYSCQQIWKSNAHVQKLINSDINMISYIDVYTSSIILQFSVHNIQNPTTNWSADKDIKNYSEAFIVQPTRTCSPKSGKTLEKPWKK